MWVNPANREQTSLHIATYTIGSGTDALDGYIGLCGGDMACVCTENSAGCLFFCHGHFREVSVMHTSMATDSFLRRYNGTINITYPSEDAGWCVAKQ